MEAAYKRKGLPFHWIRVLDIEWRLWEAGTAAGAEATGRRQRKHSGNGRRLWSLKALPQ